MNCAEFQKVLPYIIESGGKAEEDEHLRVCPVCADLVKDLTYIAEQAKLLLPMHEPSPKVWDDIQGSLEREGLVRPARARGRLLGPTPEVSYGWVAAAAAAAVLLIFGLFLYSRGIQAGDHGPNVASGVIPQPTGFGTQDDEQLLNAIGDARPQLRTTYESNLKQVNASIQDAQQSMQQYPDDQEARQHLRDAYDQKAMIYEMAMRSLQ